MEFENMIKMWREELERQKANLGVQNVFNGMLIYMGGLYQETKRLRSVNEWGINIAEETIKSLREENESLRSKNFTNKEQKEFIETLN